MGDLLTLTTVLKNQLAGFLDRVKRNPTGTNLCKIDYMRVKYRGSERNVNIAYWQNVSDMVYVIDGENITKNIRDPDVIRVTGWSKEKKEEIVQQIYKVLGNAKVDLNWRRKHEDHPDKTDKHGVLVMNAIGLHGFFEIVPPKRKRRRLLPHHRRLVTMERLLDEIEASMK